MRHPSRIPVAFSLLCALLPVRGSAQTAPSEPAVATTCTYGGSLLEPGGPHLVGTVAHDFIARDGSDTQRAEPWRNGDKRRLALQIWYPARAPRGAPVGYFTRKERDSHAASWFFKGASTDLCEVDLVTSSYEGADAKPGSFPVILFHHGAGGYVKQNTLHAEHLASHGYVVVSVGHPYGSITFKGVLGLLSVAGLSPPPGGASVITYANGEVVYPADGSIIADIAPLPVLGSAGLFSFLDALTGVFRQSDQGPTVLALHAGLEHMYQRTLATWTEDQKSVLRELQRLNDERGARLGTTERNVLFGHLDLSEGKLGVFGHSLGGALAGKSCGAIGCAAAINLDGGQWASKELFLQSPAHPFMLLSQRLVRDVNAYHYHPLPGGKTRDDLHRIELEYVGPVTGTAVPNRIGHYDFTDVVAFNSGPFVQTMTDPSGKPFPILVSTDRDTKRNIAMLTRDIIRHFFDRYIKKAPSGTSVDLKDPDSIMGILTQRESCGGELDLSVDVY